MICDTTAQIDIRQIVKSHGRLPEEILFRGERFVTTSTATAFGGRRQWWLCPSCNRRCAIVYRRAHGPFWGCRICLGGRYASEHKSPQHRLLQKAFKIRKRLGQKKGGIVARFPDKPARMHSSTYERLRAEAAEIEMRIWAIDQDWLRRIKASEN